MLKTFRQTATRFGPNTPTDYLDVSVCSCSRPVGFVDVVRPGALNVDKTAFHSYIVEMRFKQVAKD